MLTSLPCLLFFKPAWSIAKKLRQGTATQLTKYIALEHMLKLAADEDEY
jgi:hypothetical protein